MKAHGVSFHARGMHCSGCEHIIEDAVRKLPGVQRIKADYATETVGVVFDPALTNIEDICAAVSQRGYRCALPDEVPAPRNRLKTLAAIILGVVGILLIIFLDTWFISTSGAPDVSKHMSYGLILTLGLLTGFHCVGMCGGFVLSYTADDARMGQNSHLSHLLYGAGKTLSYTVIGAMFGLLGAVIAFTPMLRGVAGVAAGLFLIVFGLNMLNLFPALRRIRLKLPASLSWAVSGQQTRSRNRPFVIGLLNGLMIACGPLQAMYVMAAGTGSAIEGGKMLFTFGAGTLPVLLSFGFLTSLISGALTHQLLRASGVILILLGAVMINRGLILTGAGYDLQSALTTASTKLGLAKPPAASSAVESHVQTIAMDVVKSGFEPNHFVLRRGVPVRWIIDGKEITHCNKRIVVPKLGLEFDVKEGAQTIEFTPSELGVIPWSCWMGMLHGQFEVIADVEVATKAPQTVEPKIGAPARPAIDEAAPAPPALARTSEPEKSAATPATYKVVAGDSLAKIARKLYGDARKWTEIATANPHLNRSKLKAGQIIQLPAPPLRETKREAK